MLEIIRRVILGIGVFSGLWYLAAIPHELYRVQPVDWNAERQRKQDHSTDAIRTMSREIGGENLKGIDLAPNSRGTLDQFVKSETEGRLIRVTGERWQGFFNALAAPNPPKALADRKGRSFWNESFYFRPDEGPLPEIVKSFSHERTFQYVAIDGERTEYLGVTRVGGSDLVSQAPFELLYPTRNIGWAILGLTLLAYALLPWPKVVRESIRYSRVRGAVLPDLIGAVIGGMFFILPVFVTNSNGYGEGIFGSGGWGYLTGFCWFMSLLILSVWVIAAWYTSESLEIVGSGLRLTNLRGRTEFGPDAIEQVTIGRLDSPKFSRALIFISALVSWRALGMALIASRPEYAFTLLLRDGKRFRFAGTSLIGAPQMIGWLRDQGVTIDPQVYELINREPGDPVYTSPFPPMGHGIGTAVGVVCLGLPLAFAFMKTMPSPPLDIAPGVFGEKPYAKPKNEDWVPSPDLMQKERDTLKEIAQLRDQMNAIDLKLKTAPESDRAALLKESNSCFERINQLHDEFERARKAAGAKD